MKNQQAESYFEEWIQREAVAEQHGPRWWASCTGSTESWVTIFRPLPGAQLADRHPEGAPVRAAISSTGSFRSS